MTNQKYKLFGSLSVVFIVTSIILVGSLFPALESPTAKLGSSRLQFETFTEYTSQPYDMGIWKIYVAFNDTGSWVEVTESPLEYDDTTVFQMNASVSCKITIRHTLNKTLLGFAGASDARLLFRIITTVTNETDVLQGTYYNGTNTDFDVVAGLIYYNDCEVILNFLSVYDQIYTVNVDYDTFW